MLKKNLLLIVLCIMSLVSFAQTKTGSLKGLLCKKWLLERVKEADGEMDSLSDEDKNSDFIQFLPDGTVINLKDSDRLAGKWKLDSITMVLSVTRSSGDESPQTDTAQILKLTTSNLIMKGKDEDDGDEITLYFRAE